MSSTARTILARLVLAHGDLVEIDDLYQEAWPDPDVETGREHRMAVHRRVLEIQRCISRTPSNASSLVVTERSARTGYRLVLDTPQVDIFCFENFILRATAARDAITMVLLTQALGLWTESPLGHLPDKSFVRDGVARLVGLRDRACRDLAEIAREQGRWADASAVFGRLLRAQPSDTELGRLINALRDEVRPQAAGFSGDAEAMPE
jgi:DNA-binding SARP family transcriptional activator